MNPGGRKGGPENTLDVDNREILIDPVTKVDATFFAIIAKLDEALNTAINMPLSVEKLYQDGKKIMQNEEGGFENSIPGKLLGIKKPIKPKEKKKK